MRIVLLRHGQTASNVTHALDTAVPGPDLTELGQRQAAAVPDALADQHVDAVWASTALRAQQTAAPLAAARRLEVGVLDGLREVEAGELEMRSDEEAVRRYVEVVMAWGAGDLAAAVPGAQDGAAVMARFDAAVEQVAGAAAAVGDPGVAGPGTGRAGAAAGGVDGAGAGCAVVVSHGAVIRLWTAVRVAGVGTATMSQRWLGNTGAVVIEQAWPGDGDDPGHGGAGSDGWGDDRAGGSGDRGGRWRLVEWRGDPLGGAHLAPRRDEEGPLAPPPVTV